jgi:hypothetical protein
MGVVEALITAGAVGSFLTVLLALARVAVSAERRRADDWRHNAETSAAANAVNAGNIEKLITSVEQLATAQREMMSVLQRVAAERQGTA